MARAEQEITCQSALYPAFLPWYNGAIITKHATMAGTKKGSLMRKLGLKGKTSPGEMISSMNRMKGKELSKEVKASPKDASIIRKIT